MADRDLMLKEIRSGNIRLRPTKTVDKSKPLLKAEIEYGNSNNAKSSHLQNSSRTNHLQQQNGNGYAHSDTNGYLLAQQNGQQLRTQNGYYENGIGFEQPQISPTSAQVKHVGQSLLAQPIANAPPPPPLPQNGFTNKSRQPPHSMPVQQHQVQQQQQQPQRFQQQEFNGLNQSKGMPTAVSANNNSRFAKANGVQSVMPDRDALLQEIVRGRRLRRVVTNDRSTPCVTGKVVQENETFNNASIPSQVSKARQSQSPGRRCNSAMSRRQSEEMPDCYADARRCQTPVSVQRTAEMDHNASQRFKQPQNYQPLSLQPTNQNYKQQQRQQVPIQQSMSASVNGDEEVISSRLPPWKSAPDTNKITTAMNQAKANQRCFKDSNSAPSKMSSQALQQLRPVVNWTQLQNNAVLQQNGHHSNANFDRSIQPIGKISHQRLNSAGESTGQSSPTSNPDSVSSLSSADSPVRASPELRPSFPPQSRRPSQGPSSGQNYANRQQDVSAKINNNANIMNDHNKSQQYGNSNSQPTNSCHETLSQSRLRGRSYSTEAHGETFIPNGNASHAAKPARIDDCNNSTCNGERSTNRAKILPDVNKLKMKFEDGNQNSRRQSGDFQGDSLDAMKSAIIQEHQRNGYFTSRGVVTVLPSVTGIKNSSVLSADAIQKCHAHRHMSVTLSFNFQPLPDLQSSSTPPRRSSAIGPHIVQHLPLPVHAQVSYEHEISVAEAPQQARQQNVAVMLPSVVDLKSKYEATTDLHTTTQPTVYGVSKRNLSATSSINSSNEQAPKLIAQFYSPQAYNRASIDEATTNSPITVAYNGSRKESPFFKRSEPSTQVSELPANMRKAQGQAVVRALPASTSKGPSPSATPSTPSQSSQCYQNGLTTHARQDGCNDAAYTGYKGGQNGRSRVSSESNVSATDGPKRDFAVSAQASDASWTKPNGLQATWKVRRNELPVAQNIAALQSKVQQAEERKRSVDAGSLDLPRKAATTNQQQHPEVHRNNNRNCSATTNNNVNGFYGQQNGRGSRTVDLNEINQIPVSQLKQMVKFSINVNDVNSPISIAYSDY